MTLISLHRVEKTYLSGHASVRALRGVSLSIRPGEFVAVMGASGSGKSTLLNVLGLLDGYESGSYRLAGVDTSRLDDDALAALRARSIGFVFQQFNLLPRLTAADNITLPLLYRGGTGERLNLDRLARTLTLSGRLHHTPARLSGGQQQRVAIARALVNRPQLILADEPTGNLDSRTQGDIMRLLARLNRGGLTIVLVTHEQDVARYASRRIWMRDGRIVSDRRGRGRRGSPRSRRPAAPTPAPVRWLPALAAHAQGAARALTANKVRALLSTLGITIGVGAVITVFALGAGAQGRIKESVDKFASNTVSITANWQRSDGRGKADVTRLTLEDAEVLPRAHPLIGRSVPTLWRNTVVTANGRNHSTRVAGCPPAYADLQRYRPKVGRFFSDREMRQRARVCVIGHTVARELFPGGENPVGRIVRLNRVPYTVIGLLPEKGTQGRYDPDDQIFMPLTTGMHRFAGARYIDAIDVEIGDTKRMDEVIDAIQRFMAHRHRHRDDDTEAVTVRNWVAMREAGENIVKTLSLLLALIASISLLVGGIGIMNIMLVSVTERTREIGLRKAVGARKRDVLFQFLVEATSVSVAGGALGILLGSALAGVIAAATGWPVRVTGASVLLAFGFSAAVGIGFGFWPARRAAALHPSDALRHE